MAVVDIPEQKIKFDFSEKVQTKPEIKPQNSCTDT